MTTTTSNSWVPLNVLIPLYTGFNTLDVNGPLDVICNYAIREEDGTSRFNITTTAKEAGPVLAYEGITMQADESFETSIEKLKKGDYDVLLVPGAGGSYANDLVPEDAYTDKDGTKVPARPADPILDVIKAFYKYDNTARVHKPLHPERKTPPPPTAKVCAPKWLISICTGGLPCAGAGIFENINATTHFGAIPTCIEICDKYGKAKSVTRQRWVYGGAFKTTKQSEVDTHILSSGGISCGLDASLYFVAQLFGIQDAYNVANIMDYKWNVVSNLTTDPVVI